MRRLFSAVPCFMWATGGCIPFVSNPAQNNPTIDPLQEELDANLAKWVASGIDTYEYQFVRACECPREGAGPIIVTVESGVVKGVRRPDDSDMPPWEGGSYPIEQLFAEVQEAIDGDPDSIIVTYDAEYGYPRQIYIDWRVETADEETAYEASDLVSKPLLAELNRRRGQWASHRINIYEYEFQNACYCEAEIVQPTIITVDNGQVTALRRVEDGVAFEPYEGAPYPTITELFDTVESGLKTADSVEVQYDVQRGFPTQIYIDWDAGMADEETRYFASNIVILLQAQLDTARAKWVAAGLDTYEYRFGNHCSCPDHIVGPTIIAVEDGQVTQLRSPEDDAPFEPYGGARYPTIDELFDDIQTALDGGRGMDAVSALYDEQWGFPTHMYIDWDPGVADEETSYTASNLVVP